MIVAVLGALLSLPALLVAVLRTRPGHATCEDGSAAWLTVLFSLVWPFTLPWAVLVLAQPLVERYLARRDRETEVATAAFQATAHDLLRKRIDHLEAENARLTNELAALRAERGTYRES